MKLYFLPGSCSLAPHILALEAGLGATFEKVDTKGGKTASGADFKTINPKGYVPVLELDGGQGVLTEAAVILQFIADQKPEAKLLPAPAAGLPRYRAQEWLNFIATELHKGVGKLFAAGSDEERKKSYEAVAPKLKIADDQLAKTPYLLGDAFSAADVYLFVVTNWVEHLKQDLSRFPNIVAMRKRVFAREKVQQAMRDEGILH